MCTCGIPGKNLHNENRSNGKEPSDSNNKEVEKNLKHSHRAMKPTPQMEFEPYKTDTGKQYEYSNESNT